MLQRAPDDGAGTLQSYVFAGDKRLATDKAYAESRGREIAARLRAAGQLSADDRLELNGMLAFFQGAAKDAYIAQIEPALVQVASVPAPPSVAPEVGGLPAPRIAPAAPGETHIGDTNVAIALDTGDARSRSQPANTPESRGRSARKARRSASSTIQSSNSRIGQGKPHFPVVGCPSAATDRAERTAIIRGGSINADIGGRNQDEMIVRQALLVTTLARHDQGVRTADAR